LLENGESSMQALVRSLQVRTVPPEEWRRTSPDGVSFFSVNTAEDLRKAESFG
jgi:molybdopterin-guanine dinucleotide biosynthesis protein A